MTALDSTVVHECSPGAGCIAIDLFGLHCYNRPQTTALVVVFLSAPFVGGRSRLRTLSADTGTGLNFWGYPAS